MVDVACPLCGVGIWPSAKSREKIEFEVIVGVDQPGKKEVVAQVNCGDIVGIRRILAADALDSAARDFEISWDGGLCIECDVSAE